MTRPVTGRRLRAAAAALAAALALAAIVFAATTGFRSSDSDPATLRGFQIRVLSISQAAAENRMDGALAALQALESDLDAAARDGRISAPRLRAIETALEAVRVDIQGHLASQAALAGAAAAPATTETVPQEAPNPQPQPVQPVPEEPVTVPQPAPGQAEPPAAVPDVAKDNKGKDKGQGKP